ncbi:MAG TPA: ABC transporter permease [Aggregatilineales bacterium]|nr:ABC transporter permease [Aggregatilineales bacterium]
MSTIDERVEPAAGLMTAATRGARSRQPSAPWMAFLWRLLLSDYFVLYLTIIFFVVASFFFPTLSAPGNISNQLSNIWPLLAVAVGQTFVLILGGIDLSVTSIMAVTSVGGALLMTQVLDGPTFDKSPLWGTLINENGGLLSGNPQAVLIAVAFMLLLGTLIGLWNGFAITRFKMAPFMVTLVSMIVFSALALWLTASRNVSGLPADFVLLGKGDIVSVFLGPKLNPDIARRDVLPFITYPFAIAVTLAVVAHYILGRTVFGRHMYSIGTNRRASEISGVPSQRVIMLVYAFSGFCAAVSAILYSARLEIGRPSLGDGLLMDIIGAAVIGGTSLFGGKGTIKGTFFGVAFFILLLNILNAMRLSPFVIDAVKGVVILTAALLDITRTRLANREQRA